MRSSPQSPWRLVLCGLGSIARATPTITFPINSQVPPVARIGEPFSFVFSASTFSSTDPLTYTLHDAPPWLLIDSGARRLYGTPNESDVPAGKVVGVTGTLVATDRSGSAKLGYTFVASRQSPPTVAIPLADQVPSDFGAFSSPHSLLTYPETPFSFALSPHTFANPVSGAALTYYAITGDNSPLPAWIFFDAASMTFSGQTPTIDALVQPPQTFAFKLVATDVLGFSAASLVFAIVVNMHEMTTSQSLVSINVTATEPVSNRSLKDAIEVDGKTAGPLDLVISTTDMPGWLSVDPASWEIRGRPPTRVESSTFIVTFKDGYSDTLNVSVSLATREEARNKTGSMDLHQAMFKHDLPETLVTAGRLFSIDLGRFLTNASDVEISLTPDRAADWVQYDADRQLINGTAPATQPDSVVAVAVKATSKSSSKAESETLVLHVVAASASSQATKANAAAGAGHWSTKTCVLAVVMPILFLVLALACFVFLCRARRPRQSSKHRPIKAGDISHPKIESFQHRANESSERYDCGGNLEASVPPGPEERGVRHAALDGRKKCQSGMPDLPYQRKQDKVATLCLEKTHSMSTTSWLAAQAVGFSWRFGGGGTGKKDRQSKTRSFLSTTSAYEAELNMACASRQKDVASSTLLGARSDPINHHHDWFRNRLELDLPVLAQPPPVATASRCPQGKPDFVHRTMLGSPALIATTHTHNKSLQPSRPPSSLSSDMPPAAAWPWASVIQHRQFQARRHTKNKATKLAMTINRILWHRRKKKATGQPGDDGHSGNWSADEAIRVSILPPLVPARPIRHFRPKSAARPVTTYGIPSSRHTNLAAAQQAQNVKTKTASENRTGLPLPTLDLTTVPRDSLGIFSGQYQALVSSSPFHPSKSSLGGSSLENWLAEEQDDRPADENEALSPESDGSRIGVGLAISSADKTPDMTSPRPKPTPMPWRRTGPKERLPAPSITSSLSFSSYKTNRPNWMTYPVTGLDVGEGPAMPRPPIKDWRGDDDHAADLMSSSGWPSMMKNNKKAAGTQDRSSLGELPIVGSASQGRAGVSFLGSAAALFGRGRENAGLSSAVRKTDNDHQQQQRVTGLRNQGSSAATEMAKQPSKHSSS